MPTSLNPSAFQVRITLQAAGPVRPRTKHKVNKLLQAERIIELPFVPYPGLYLTFSKPQKRGMDLTLYLRVRTIEWNVTESRFECVAYEILGSPVFDEMLDFRGGVRIEEHFQRLVKTLRAFDFEVDEKVQNTNLLTNYEDGTLPLRLMKTFGRRQTFNSPTDRQTAFLNCCFVLEWPSSF
jgi:hypothetical protein